MSSLLEQSDQADWLRVRTNGGAFGWSLHSKLHVCQKIAAAPRVWVDL